MTIKELTDEQKSEIAIEMLHKQPIQTVGQVALLNLAKIGIETGSKNVVLQTDATIKGKRYNCKMEVSYELIFLVSKI